MNLHKELESAFAHWINPPKADPETERKYAEFQEDNERHAAEDDNLTEQEFV